MQTNFVTEADEKSKTNVSNDNNQTAANDSNERNQIKAFAFECLFLTFLCECTGQFDQFSFF